MKDSKIEITHPTSKKAVAMDIKKYSTIKNFIIDYLEINGKATHTEILEALEKEINQSNTKFQGSISWYMEWVKLDLEARKEINRIKNKSVVNYTIFKKRKSTFRKVIR